MYNFTEKHLSLSLISIDIWYLWDLQILGDTELLRMHMNPSKWNSESAPYRVHHDINEIFYLSSIIEAPPACGGDFYFRYFLPFVCKAV